MHSDGLKSELLRDLLITTKDGDWDRTILPKGLCRSASYGGRISRRSA